jgi:Zn-dependent M32 family carboxypeptidase
MRAKDGLGGIEARSSESRDIATTRTMSLVAAVAEVIDVLRGRSTLGREGAHDWDRIVRAVTEKESLNKDEVHAMEKAIADVYGGWSDSQRRAAWYETESGMTDDDDGSCDTSFNGIGYALQIELLDEVTQAAWREADELKAAAKRL